MTPSFTFRAKGANGEGVVYAHTAGKMFDLGSWMETQGYPPRAHFGWGSADEFVRYDLGLALCLCMGYDLDAAVHFGKQLADDILPLLPPEGWQVDDAEFVGFFACRGLLLRICLPGVPVAWLAPSVN